VGEEGDFCIWAGVFVEVEEGLGFSVEDAEFAFLELGVLADCLEELGDGVEGFGGGVFHNETRNRERSLENAGGCRLFGARRDGLVVDRMIRRGDVYSSVQVRDGNWVAGAKWRQPVGPPSLFQIIIIVAEERVCAGFIAEAEFVPTFINDWPPK